MWTGNKFRPIPSSAEPHSSRVCFTCGFMIPDVKDGGNCSEARRPGRASQPCICRMHSGNASGVLIRNVNHRQVMGPRAWRAWERGNEVEARGGPGAGDELEGCGSGRQEFGGQPGDDRASSSFYPSTSTINSFAGVAEKAEREGGRTSSSFYPSTSTIKSLAGVAEWPGAAGTQG